MVFNYWVSTVLCFFWFCFTLLCDCTTFSAIKKQNQNQSLVACVQFSCIWCWLHVITSNSDWFTKMSVSLNGQGNSFGFGFTRLNWKLLWLLLSSFVYIGIKPLFSIIKNCNSCSHWKTLCWIIYSPFMAPPMRLWHRYVNHSNGFYSLDQITCFCAIVQ